MPDQNLLIELRNAMQDGPTPITLLHVAYAELFAYGTTRVEYRHPEYDNLGEYIEYDTEADQWVFRGRGFDYLNVFPFSSRESWEAAGGAEPAYIVTWIDSPTPEDLEAA